MSRERGKRYRRAQRKAMRAEGARLTQVKSNRRHMMIYAAVMLISCAVAWVCLSQTLGKDNPNQWLLGVAGFALVVFVVYGLCFFSTVTSGSYRRGETTGIDTSGFRVWDMLRRKG